MTMFYRPDCVVMDFVQLPFVDYSTDHRESHSAHTVPTMAGWGALGPAEG